MNFYPRTQGNRAVKVYILQAFKDNHHLKYIIRASFNSMKIITQNLLISYLKTLVLLERDLAQVITKDRKQMKVKISLLRERRRDKLNNSRREGTLIQKLE